MAEPRRLEPTAAAFSSGPAILIAAIAALGGLLFGYDTGVVAGAELYFTKDFNLSAAGEGLAVTYESDWMTRAFCELRTL